MRSELLGGEDKLSIRLTAIGPLRGIIKAVDGELAFDRHGLVFIVIEIEPATEATGGWLARHVVHRRRP